MQTFVSALKNRADSLTNFDELGEFVHSIDYDSIDYKSSIPAIETPDNYSRNILMMHPIEAVILHWPPEVESAIHYHEGFYGYVVVLEGELDNIEYTLDDDKLKESTIMCGMRGGILPEKDGVIHKLANNSKTKAAVTLHIYSPPLEDFSGMKIYDIDKNRIGTLSATAKTASWSEPKKSFDNITENAFTFLPQKSQKSSHSIFPIVPKPVPQLIYSMLGEYYNEQAKDYDNFDTTHHSRNAYTNSLNNIIASEYKTLGSITNELALACGTGRRVADIRKESGKDYHIVGVDLSKEMCDLAETNNIETYCNTWLDCDLPKREFDSATFLYAFGHICSEDERIASLKKINKYLKVGGTFYFDVFNVNDENEWGLKAVKAFEEIRLDRMGYERGDVFYKKRGGNAAAYLHYFNETEITNLLAESGFKVEWVKHIGYTYKSGEELSEANSGSLFIKAVKK